MIKVQDILKSQDNKVYKILYNSLKANKISHAYLFCGPKATKKKEAAILLVQSILCQNNDVFACEECDLCQRIKNNQYADLRYLDAETNKISVEEIRELISDLQKTSVERYSKKFYIINKVENLNESCLNALLKFLEEPSSDDVFAIMLTENLEQVLPTIRSRCQIVRFDALNYQYIYDFCRENELDEIDSYYLSNLYQNTDVILSKVNDEIYLTAKDLFNDFLEIFPNDINLSLIELENSKYLKNKKNTTKQIKEVIKIFLMLFELLYSDVSKDNKLDIPYYNKALNQIKNSKYNNIEINRIILEALNQINNEINFNTNLILEKMFYQIEEISNGRK